MEMSFRKMLSKNFRAVRLGKKMNSRDTVEDYTSEKVVILHENIRRKWGTEFLHKSCIISCIILV